MAAAERLVAAAKAPAPDRADAIAVRSVALSVQVLNGAVEERTGGATNFGFAFSLEARGVGVDQRPRAWRG